MLICIQKFIQNKYKEMPLQMSSGICPFGKRLSKGNITLDLKFSHLFNKWEATTHKALGMHDLEYAFKEHSS